MLLVHARNVQSWCNYSDASSTGFGGYLVDTGEGIVQGMWDNSESNQNSTWPELKAVDLVLKSLVTKLSCRRTKWFTDNQAVARIATRGSMKKELQNIVLSICKTCLKPPTFILGRKTKKQIV